MEKKASRKAAGPNRPQKLAGRDSGKASKGPTDEERAAMENAVLSRRRFLSAKTNNAFCSLGRTRG